MRGHVWVPRWMYVLVGAAALLQRRGRFWRAVFDAVATAPSLHERWAQAVGLRLMPAGARIYRVCREGHVTETPMDWPCLFCGPRPMPRMWEWLSRAGAKR